VAGSAFAVVLTDQAKRLMTLAFLAVVVPDAVAQVCAVNGPPTVTQPEGTNWVVEHIE
jgi:hypothetical protein